MGGSTPFSTWYAVERQENETIVLARSPDLHRISSSASVMNRPDRRGVIPSTSAQGVGGLFDDENQILGPWMSTLSDCVAGALTATAGFGAVPGRAGSAGAGAKSRTATATGAPAAGAARPVTRRRDFGVLVDS
jgi:hypothetical protein